MDRHRLLARIRAHPFLHVPEARIRTRAYFAWENQTGKDSGDAVSNWCEAEDDETEALANLLLVAPRNVGNPALDSFEFDSLYSLVASYTCPGGGKKVYRGARHPRKCALCLKVEPEVRFRKAAHLIPEQLGNKTLLSNEECDTCNEGHGSGAESELGNWFLAERAIAQIKSKGSGTTKFKRGRAGELRSSIGGQPAGQPLSLEMVHNDDSIKIDLKDERTLAITMSTMPYRPYEAIKAIAKAAFLMLDPPSRARFEHVRQWIRGEIEVPTAELDTFFIPGEPMFGTGIAVSTRDEPTSASNLPELVTMIWMGNVVLVWAAPNQLLQHCPVVWPLLPRSRRPPYLPTHRRYVAKSGARAPASTATFEMHHAVRLLKYASSPIEVELEFDDGPGQTKLRTTLETPLEPDVHDRVEYTLAGGDLIGCLRFVVGATGTVRYEPTTTKSELRCARLSFLLLRALARGAKVSIVDPTPSAPHRREVFVWPENAGAAGQPTPDIDGPIQFVDALETISGILESPLFYMPDPSEEDVVTALRLAHGIRHGCVAYRPPNGRLSITATKDYLVRTLDAIRESPDEISARNQVTYMLGGQHVDPGPHEIHLLTPRIEISEADLKILLSSWNDDQPREFELTCSAIVLVFLEHQPATEPMASHLPR